MKKFIKRNIKIILGFTLGLIWSAGVVYATANGYLFDSDEVSYDNTSSGLTSENVQDALDELYANSDAYLAGLNSAHPIGSIFMTVNSNYDTAAKVGTALGGEWQAIGEGRVLIGAGTNETYTFTVGGTQTTVAGNTDTASQTITNPLGEYTHQLNINEMPSHTHTQNAHRHGVIYNSGGAGDLFTVGNANRVGGSGGIFAYGAYATATNQNTGGSYYHNNIQPYLVVYMYKRTA